MFNPRRNKKGFTIIELIVVIAILAILAAIAIPSFIGITDQANEKVAIANARNIATAVNTYNALNPDTKIASVGASDYSTLKSTLEGSDFDLWPKGLAEADYTDALVYLDYTNNVATVKQAATPSV
jgi:type IV pilus assembly protein PilA